MRALDAPTGADRILEWRKSLEHRRGPMRLAELALHAARLAESMTAHSLSLSEARGEPASCRKGCAACCRQVVPVSPAEAFLIEDILDGLPENRARAVSGNFRRIARRLRKEGLDSAPLFNRAGDYFRLGLACPFLQGDSCSIHPLRPMGCREHIALSPAAYCADFPAASVRLMPMIFPAGEALAAATAAVTRTAPEMIPLARVLEWTAAHRGMGEGTWEAETLIAAFADHCLAKFPPGAFRP